MLNIKYDLAKELKAKPDWNNLGFGKYFTDICSNNSGYNF